MTKKIESPTMMVEGLVRKTKELIKMADLFHLSRCYDKKIHIELID